MAEEKRILCSEIIGKEVITEGGIVIGNVVDLDIETSSGRVLMLIVKPKKGEIPIYFKRDDDGNLLIPFSYVRNIMDYVVLYER